MLAFWVALSKFLPKKFSKCTLLIGEMASPLIHSASRIKAGIAHVGWPVERVASERRCSEMRRSLSPRPSRRAPPLAVRNRHRVNHKKLSCQGDASAQHCNFVGERSRMSRVTGCEKTSFVKKPWMCAAPQQHASRAVPESSPVGALPVRFVQRRAFPPKPGLRKSVAAQLAAAPRAELSRFILGRPAFLNAAASPTNKVPCSGSMARIPAGKTSRRYMYWDQKRHPLQAGLLHALSYRHGDGYAGF